MTWQRHFESPRRARAALHLDMLLLPKPHAARPAAMPRTGDTVRCPPGRTAAARGAQRRGGSVTRLGATQEQEECVLSTVTADNASDPACTKVDIEVSDFPGLLRVISWVLVGMEVRIERAELRTTSEGKLANNTLWLVQAFSQHKLTDAEADAVCTRLGDHLDVCAPRALGDHDCTRATCGGVSVELKDKTTVIHLDASLDSSHLLLDAANVFSAMDLNVAAARKEHHAWTFTLSEAVAPQTLKSIALLLSNQIAKPTARATQLLEVPE